MAFGDGHNDIEMLDIVGYPIVMGNGSEEVKKHGRYICQSVNEDGILDGLNIFNFCKKAQGMSLNLYFVNGTTSLIASSKEMH